MTKRNIGTAAGVGFVVALVMAFASFFGTTVIPESGSWFAILRHPSFWPVYAQAVVWFFASGFVTGVVSLWISTRRANAT